MAECFIKKLIVDAFQPNLVASALSSLLPSMSSPSLFPRTENKCASWQAGRVALIVTIIPPKLTTSEIIVKVERKAAILPLLFRARCDSLFLNLPAELHASKPTRATPIAAPYYFLSWVRQLPNRGCCLCISAFLHEPKHEHGHPADRTLCIS